MSYKIGDVSLDVVRATRVDLTDPSVLDALKMVKVVEYVKMAPDQPNSGEVAATHFIAWLRRDHRLCCKQGWVPFLIEGPEDQIQKGLKVQAGTLEIHWSSGLLLYDGQKTAFNMSEDEELFDAHHCQDLRLTSTRPRTPNRFSHLVWIPQP